MNGNHFGHAMAVFAEHVNRLALFGAAALADRRVQRHVHPFRGRCSGNAVTGTFVLRARVAAGVARRPAWI